MSKKRLNNVSARRDPRLLSPGGSLKFDNFDESVVLNDEELATKFMSDYNELIDPFVRWKRYWDSSAHDADAILSTIRNFYKKLVLSGRWTENKFVAITNEIFDRNIRFTESNYDFYSRKYDNGIDFSDENRGPRHKRRRSV